MIRYDPPRIHKKPRSLVRGDNIVLSRDLVARVLKTEKDGKDWIVYLSGDLGKRHPHGVRARSSIVFETFEDPPSGAKITRLIRPTRNPAK